MIEENVYPRWALYGTDKVWAVGRERDYAPGSAEIRNVVIKHKENLYIVPEPSLREWQDVVASRQDNYKRALRDIIHIFETSAALSNCIVDYTAAFVAIEKIARAALVNG